MKTGCLNCDKVQAQTGSVVQLCPKHTLEYLQWHADNAKKDYEEAKEQYEKEQKDVSPSNTIS